MSKKRERQSKVLADYLRLQIRSAGISPADDWCGGEAPDPGWCGGIAPPQDWCGGTVSPRQLLESAAARPSRRSAAGLTSHVGHLSPNPLDR